MDGSKHPIDYGVMVQAGPGKYGVVGNQGRRIKVQFLFSQLYCGMWKMVIRSVS